MSDNRSNDKNGGEEEKEEEEEKKRETRYRVVALYKFVSVPADELTALQREIEDLFRSCSVRGTILLATEGINGTVSYRTDLTEGADPILTHLRTHPYFEGLRTNVSYVMSKTPIFHRLKIKIKPEIVTIGLGGNGHGEGTGVRADPLLETTFENDAETADCAAASATLAPKVGRAAMVDPTLAVGTHVKAGKEWNELLQDPEVLVIDTRNDYEVAIGTFHNAMDPHTTNFREFPFWLQHLAKEQWSEHAQHNQTDIPASLSSTLQKQPLRKPKAVAMFCTGGIRCEKATSFALLNQVFPADVPVYHLEGGILAYLRDTPPEESLWRGECFVFDGRVAVKHGLEASTTYTACRGCRRPVSPQQKESPEYEEGICCPGCYRDLTDEQRRRFEQRHLQIKLAPDRSHIYDAKEKRRREEAAAAVRPLTDHENREPRGNQSQ